MQSEEKAKKKRLTPSSPRTPREEETKQGEQQKQ